MRKGSRFVQVCEGSSPGFWFAEVDPSSVVLKRYLSKPAKPKGEWIPRSKPATSLKETQSAKGPPSDSRKYSGCNGLHGLQNCSTFKDLPVKGRYEVVSNIDYVWLVSAVSTGPTSVSKVFEVLTASSRSSSPGSKRWSR